MEDLVVENAGWIKTKAHGYFDNAQDADDLAGETIFRCLKNASRFDSRKSFRPWALTIMQNLFITQYNRRRCVMFADFDDVEERCGGDLSDQRISLRTIMETVRSVSRRRVGIDAVILYAIGYTITEIAGKFGIPEGTVRSRISIGRKLLRNALI